MWGPKPRCTARQVARISGAGVEDAAVAPGVPVRLPGAGAVLEEALVGSGGAGEATAARLQDHHVMHRAGGDVVAGRRVPDDGHPLAPALPGGQLPLQAVAPREVHHSALVAAHGAVPAADEGFELGHRGLGGGGGSGGRYGYGGRAVARSRCRAARGLRRGRRNGGAAGGERAAQCGASLDQVLLRVAEPLAGGLQALVQRGRSRVTRGGRQWYEGAEQKEREDDDQLASSHDILSTRSLRRQRQGLCRRSGRRQAAVHPHASAKRGF